MRTVKEIIANRAALELKDGDIVNLGFGIPMLVPKFLRSGVRVVLQQENGVLGYEGFALEGEADDTLTDAAGNHIRLGIGASFFDSSLSFSMIRGGHIDICVLGALQVDEKGNLANWTIPGKWSPGVGGGMELAQKVRRVIVTTQHTDKKGRSKLKKTCDFPLTAAAVVDTIITDLGFFRIRDGRMVLEEIPEGIELKTVLAKTDADLEVLDPLRPWKT